MKKFYMSPVSMAFLHLTFMTDLVFSNFLQGSSRRQYDNPNVTQDNFQINEANIYKVIANFRDDVELNCPITKVSSLQYEWYKQNTNGVGHKKITQFRGRFELSIQGQIKIRSLNYEDSGTYICKLANHFETYTIQLTVSGDDTFKNNLLKLPGSRKDYNEDYEEPYSEPWILRDQLPKEKQHVFKGLSIFLKCESKGNPKPTITWYKGDKILSSSKGHLSTWKLINVSQLDNAVYKCEAVNIFGLSVYEVDLKVVDAWQGVAEILEMTPSNLTSLVGNSVNISCIARFETDPHFFWAKKAKKNKSERGKVFYHIGTSTYYEALQSPLVKELGDRLYSSDLILKNVTKNDSGVYFCAVAGLQGFNLSETTVIVENDPSQDQFNYPKTVEAQWAILWTSSFIVLVILIVSCSVKMYGFHNSSKTTSNSVSTIKTQLPERSPQTMSTHCTTHQCHEAVVPLMVGSCSLSSQDHYNGYESSETSEQSHPSIHSHHHYHHHKQNIYGGASSNSTLLADLEAARSYCTNSGCSEYHFGPCRHSHGHRSTSCCSGEAYLQRIQLHYHGSQYPNFIPNAEVEINHPDYCCRNDPLQYEEYIQHNVTSTDCESSFSEPRMIPSRYLPGH